MRRSRWASGSVAVVLVAIAAWAWFSPSGTGEYADSPDGRYRTWASNHVRGTWLHGRVTYVDIEVVENATGNTVWEVQRYSLPNETPPDFGDRSRKFIRWAADSRTVSVPIGGTADLVLPVP